MRTANDFTDELFEAVEPYSAQAKALVYVMLHWTNQLPPTAEATSNGTAGPFHARSSPAWPAPPPLVEALPTRSRS